MHPPSSKIKLRCSVAECWALINIFCGSSALIMCYIAMTSDINGTLRSCAVVLVKQLHVWCSIKELCWGVGETITCVMQHYRVVLQCWWNSCMCDAALKSCAAVLVKQLHVWCSIKELEQRVSEISTHCQGLEQDVTELQQTNQVCCVLKDIFAVLL